MDRKTITGFAAGIAFCSLLYGMRKELKPLAVKTAGTALLLGQQASKWMNDVEAEARQDYENQCLKMVETNQQKELLSLTQSRPAEIYHQLLDLQKQLNDIKTDMEELA